MFLISRPRKLGLEDTTGRRAYDLSGRSRSKALIQIRSIESCDVIVKERLRFTLCLGITTVHFISVRFIFFDLNSVSHYFRD